MNTKIKVATKEQVAVIDSSWCENRSGICLSFAIPIEVMSVQEITFFSKEFIKAINQSYKPLLQNYFYAKTQSPIIAATHDGEVIMLWSFQGNNDKATKQILKNNNITQIIYD